MKRIIFLIAALGLALGSRAQADTATTDPKPWELNLGLGASATLFANGNDMSPYYSKYGFALHLPFTFNYLISPHWSMLTGLRYDIEWKPLYHRIEVYGSDEGLDFPTGPVYGTQHAHIFSSYLGIPLQVTWHPFSKHRNALSLAFDIYGAMALNTYVSISEQVLSRTEGFGEKGTFSGDYLNPWKLEVGLTLSTSKLGLLHGVRLFFNLLPSYTDTVSGEDIYLAGFQFFL